MPLPPGIVGIVLAAGRSSRMGRPKALLPCPPSRETFVAHAVRVLKEGGVRTILVVVRPGDEALRAELGRLPAAPHAIVNPDPERGQLSSLVAGIDEADARGAEAVIVLPVDLPLVRAGSVAALVAAARQSQAPILRVAHGGRPGHPVIFRRAVFDDVRKADPALGARAMFTRYGGRADTVDVDDPGILRDVDHPAEYREMFDPAE